MPSPSSDFLAKPEAVRTFPPMREFLPVDRPSKVRTVLGIVLPLVTLLPTAVIGLLLFGLTPPSYAFDGETLTVRSGEPYASPRVIGRASITEIREIDLVGGARVGGTAMPGMCAGYFRYGGGLGDVWQATDCSRRVVIIRAEALGRPLLVSPPDARVFVSALEAGRPYRATLPAPDMTLLRVLGGTLAPISLLAGVFAGITLLRGPASLRYLVGDGVLEVRSIFRTVRYPLAGATAYEHAPRGLWRVAGTGLPGYATGIFRESGQWSRAWLTDFERVIVVESEKRVLVSPADREEFLAALAAEGASVRALHPHPITAVRGTHRS